jgi:hypothetical protein
VEVKKKTKLDTKLNSGPTTVLVVSLLFVFFVIFLHIFGRSLLTLY